MRKFVQNVLITVTQSYVTAEFGYNKRTYRHCLR